MNRRDLILAALKEAGESGVSGEVVARDLSVSRVAVSKHIAALRKDGYEIEARHGKGYTLVSSPDMPLPAEVMPLVGDPMWIRIAGGHETGSTNDDARVLARAGAAEGTVVIAGQQTKGRGRLGRSWVSRQGGVYVSVVLRPAVSPADVAPLPLVIALGVAFGLESLGVDAALKWPNDVLVGSGKIAGVLLEMTAEADCVDWVVAGVGLNVRHADDRTDGASYLEDHVADLDTPRAAAALLDGIAKAYRMWRDRGFSAMREEYDRRHVLAGRDVKVRDISGAIKAEGRVSGIDEIGRLLVECDGGIVAVSAGDATLKDAS